MRFSKKVNLPALLCGLALVACALASRPFAETGLIDDWSYVRTVELLSHTGHIVYNGWSTAMLGWQLWLGALFVKLFGSSFLSARMSVLFIAVVTAYLLQRTFVRCGLSDWNAVIATLTLALSPLFLPLTVIFMTDVPGVFVIVACLYACLRAIQADTDRASTRWIVVAALASAIGGTARQTSWLGVLIMVPCAIWLLRRKKNVAIIGSASVALGVMIIVLSLRWLSHQPNVDPEPAIVHSMNVRMLRQLLSVSFRCLVGVSLLSLPVLVAFALALRQRGRRALTMVAVVLVLSVGITAFSIHHPDSAGWAKPMPPFFEAQGNIIGSAGLWECAPAFGTRPAWLSPDSRNLLATFTLFCLFSTLAVIFFGNRRRLVEDDISQISWFNLLVLLLPFLAAYAVALAPRAATTGLYDRYLLPVCLVVLLLAVRYYQDYVQPRLPAMSCVLLILAAAISVAGTHDLFAMFRATSTAAAIVQSSGVRPTEVDAGWEYNGLNELNSAGFVILPNRVNHTEKTTEIPVPTAALSCPQRFAEVFPHVSPRFSMAFNPNECGGPAGFAPVPYSTWLPWQQAYIFVVKNPSLPPL